MKVLALLLGVAAATWHKTYTLKNIKTIDTLSTFNEWTQAFDRTYESIEAESAKYMVWLDNLYIIAASNSMNKSYTLGLNQFSDMTGDEFKHYIHGDEGACFTPQEREHYIFNSAGQDLFVSDDAAPAPDSVDWTTKGVVTPVKNQGQCGSCWSFATTGVLECNYAIKNGKLNSLSEQQLVDCAIGRYGCNGCNGGNNEKAMAYVSDVGGLCLETTYPYTAKDGTCKSSSCGTKYNANTGYTRAKVDSEPATQTAAAAGCVAIGIEADQTAFQHYSSGVLTGTCGTNVDHAVLIVGYGTSGMQDYWKVKNSWGASWGMNGYILICRNCNKNGNKGECGILTDPSYPTF